MQKQVANSLKIKIAEVEKLKQSVIKAQINFSRKDRPFNFGGSTMKFHKVIPLSEHAAAVIFKQDTGVLSVFFFYYMRMNEGTWNYFAPTDSHILAFEHFGKIKMDVEEANYETKTDDEEQTTQEHQNQTTPEGEDNTPETVQ